MNRPLPSFVLELMSSPFSKVKIAIVGCGRISNNHLIAISHHTDLAEIVAVCDTSTKSVESFMDSFNQYSFKNIPLVFSSYAELLSSVSNGQLFLDLIVLCTPSGLHSSQAILAASLDINVCTEKPMATRWQDALDMVKAFDISTASLFVVKQNRFNPTLRLLKKQIDNGRFGRIYLINSNVFWQRPQSYYDQAAWRGTWEFDGGALMNQASHYVDLLQWLGGPIESVHCNTATLGRAIQVEDSCVLNYQYRSGALGSMAVTMLTFPKNLEGSITILGENGTVKIGGTSVNHVETWTFHSSSDDDLLISDVSYTSPSVYGTGHIDYYKNMISSLLYGDEPSCNGREGLKSLELLIAAYRSSRDGCPISLPLVY